MCKLGQRQQVVSHRFEAQNVLLGNENFYFVRNVLCCSETNKGFCLLRRALRKHISITHIIKV